MTARCSCNYDPPNGVDFHAADCEKVLSAGIDPVAFNQPPSARAEYTGSRGDTWSAASLVPELPDSFSLAMARVEELREAKRADLARRDRAEWECFFHFACENSLLKRQAE
jgi:hypothetical protein